MEPIACAIDGLQSSKEYYASFLPTLHSLKGNLELLDDKSLVYCQPLLKALADGFSRRFSRFFDLDDEQCQAATIAACCHPHFKMRWIHPDYENQIDKIEDIIVKSAVELSQTLKTETQIKDENNSEFTRQSYSNIV